MIAVILLCMVLYSSVLSAAAVNSTVPAKKLIVGAPIAKTLIHQVAQGLALSGKRHVLSSSSSSSSKECSRQVFFAPDDAGITLTLERGEPYCTITASCTGRHDEDAVMDNLRTQIRQLLIGLSIGDAAYPGDKDKLLYIDARVKVKSYTLIHRTLNPIWTSELLLLCYPQEIQNAMGQDERKGTDIVGTGCEVPTPSAPPAPAHV